MMVELADDMNAAAELVNRIELIRRQLYDQRAVLREKGGADELIAAADALDAKLIGVEENLYQLKLTGTGQDRVRWPTMLVGRIGYLANTVSVGDFPPTDQAREVHALLKERLAQQQGAFDELVRTELAAFNGMLQERALGPVISQLD